VIFFNFRLIYPDIHLIVVGKSFRIGPDAIMQKIKSMSVTGLELWSLIT